MEPSIEPAVFQFALATWYAHHGRRLRFRDSVDAWGVLVSEVMLQQTQAARVEPPWLAFMARFPTPAVLAAATPADALRAWSGLGYNRRALNLWHSAVAIVERHGGGVPRTVDELRALPGVGGYTARAVVAIAFGQPVAAVDTNVRRVIGRVRWGHAAPPSDVALQAAADALIDPDRSAAWTHAVMDIGATICRPRNPACDACPLNSTCRYTVERRDWGAASLVATTAARPVSGSGARRSAARPVSGSGAQRSPAEPFPRTTRWLRGRIVDRLRQADPGDWVLIAAPLGEHGVESVSAALDALATEGLLERGERGRVRLPLTAGRPA